MTGITESVKEKDDSWGYKSCGYEDERKSSEKEG
jgi:hypothetical protein